MKEMEGENRGEGGLLASAGLEGLEGFNGVSCGHVLGQAVPDTRSHDAGNEGEPAAVSSAVGHSVAKWVHHGASIWLHARGLRCWSESAINIYIVVSLWWNLLKLESLVPLRLDCRDSHSSVVSMSSTLTYLTHSSHCSRPERQPLPHCITTGKHRNTIYTSW